MKTIYPILNPLTGLEKSYKSCALAVMVKAPCLGAVKTRLVPPLMPDEAMALSINFLRDTTANIADVVATNNADGLAVYTPVGAEGAFDGLLPEGFSLLPQRNQPFGDRLFHAAEDLLQLGYESLCLIDSDSPTLPREMLVDAVTALTRPGDRIVLGPCEDGGYYLIGLKRAHRRLFTNVEWSTAKVLSQTIERATEIGLQVELLPTWYDVDDASGLKRLCHELFSPNGKRSKAAELVSYHAPYTRDYLSQLIEVAGRERIWPTATAITRAEIAS